MSTARLLDLPTELLLDILNYDEIETLDLYHVALTSRRLNSIAIPLAFTEYHPENVYALTFDGRSGRTIHRPLYPGGASSITIGAEVGILLAFDITSMDEICCTFFDSFTESSLILVHLTRFAYLLARLSSVRTVSIRFRKDDYALPHSQFLIPNPIANALNHILQLLTIKGCQHVFIYNSTYASPAEILNMDGHTDTTMAIHQAVPFPRHSAETIHNSQDTHPSRTMKVGMLSRLMLKSWRTRTSKHGLSSSSSSSERMKGSNTTHHRRHSAPFSSLATLRSIHIQSAIPLLPLCSPALIDLIHGSVHTLASLNLSRIIFDEQLFNSVLVDMISDKPSSITRFAITNCRGIWPKTLLALLQYFQDRLEYLEFDKGITILPPGYHPTFHFPKLQTINIPLDWMVYIVGPVVDSSSSPPYPNHIHIPLPSLSSTTLYCRTLETVHFTYSAFHASLTAVLEPLYFQQGPLLRHRRFSEIKVALEITLDEEKEWQMDNDRAVINMANSQINTFSSSSGAPLPWHLVTHLHLYSFKPPEDSFRAQVLARWVTTLFPGVAEVEIVLPRPTELSGSDHEQNQKRALDTAGIFILEALRNIQLYTSDPSLDIAWQKLVIGPWSFEFELSLEWNTGLHWS